MIKLGTLSKLLTESYNPSQTYVCEASMGKIPKATIELIEQLIKSGKTDEAMDVLRKAKLEKVSLLRKGWDLLSSNAKGKWQKLSKAAKGIAKVGVGGAALYGGYKMLNPTPSTPVGQGNQGKQDDKFNQPYNKIISTEPVYVMTKRHGQIFDDDDVKIKTMKEQEEELKNKQKETQQTNIDLSQIYDDNGNQIYQNNANSNFSFGNFLDKTDNAMYDAGQAFGGSIKGGLDSITDDSTNVFNTLKDTATGNYGKSEDK